MPLWQMLWTRARRRLQRLSWVFLGVAVLAHLLMSYGLMGWCGEAQLTGNPAFFLYYYITTATTIGYGDLSPQGTTGRLAAALFLLPGAVALFAASLGKATTVFIDFWRRNMTGKLDFSTLRGHTVVVGWRGQDTHKLIDFLLLDERTDDEGIVLTDTQCEENPRAQDARFVRLESFSTPDGYGRTGLRQAARIVVDTPTDEQTLAAVFAILAYCPDCGPRLKARFANEQTARLVRLHHREVETVTPLDIQVLVRATQDSGSADVALDLLSLGGGQNQYSLTWPGTAQPYGQACARLKDKLDITLIGVSGQQAGQAPQLNPPSETLLQPGNTVFYIASERLSESRVKAVFA